MKVKKMLFIALLVAQALVLFAVESMIPLPFIAPGAKIGLSNIVTVIALYIFDFKDCLLIVLLKVVLSSLFSGSLSTFFYSMSGGVLSLIAMFIVKKVGKENVSILGISIIGSVFHNIGQVLVASIIINNVNIFTYLPVLLITGLVAGIFVGFASSYMLKHLNKIGFINKIIKDIK